MRRSIRAFATSLAAFLLTVAVPAAPALAATAEIASPGEGDTVSQVVTIQVNATRQFLEGAINTVQVRMSADGSAAAAGTQVVDATCVSGCGGQNQVWAVEFDPVTFNPFGTPSAGRCNGGWWLQASVNGGAFGQGIRVVRTVAPSAPSGVTATGGTEQAAIRWTKAPEPDVVGYLVERRKGTGSWTTVANLGASADRYTDSVEAGTWSYRVVSLRGDGKTSSGEIAAPCADTGADLAAASSSATADVKPKVTSSTTGGSTTGGSTGGTSTGGTTSGGTTDGTTGGDGTTDGTTTDGGATDGADTGGDGTDGADTDGTADGTTGDGTTGDAAPVRRVGPRQAAPPPVDTAPNFSGSLDVGAQNPQVAQERYFGEDGEYSDEWDFGDAEAIVGEDLEAGGVETRTIRVPGALQTVFGEELDVMRLFGSIAAGLVMITLGLHLRRWMRAGIVD